MSEYRGDQIDAGMKSLALALFFRHSKRTLRAEEVNQSQERILAALSEKLAAVLRT